MNPVIKSNFESSLCSTNLGTQNATPCSGISLSVNSSCYLPSCGTSITITPCDSISYGTSLTSNNVNSCMNYGTGTGTTVGSSYTNTGGVCSSTNSPGGSSSYSKSSLTEENKSSVHSNICPCGCKSSFPTLNPCEPATRYQPPPKEPYCGDPLPEIFPTRFARKKLCPPGWLKFGGKVLCFNAYFQEAIPESNEEEIRTRLCVIRYYLEDDTIEVIEPKTSNAGYSQGRIIKRGKIPLPKPADNHVYTLHHLNVGCNLDFYGRIFHVYGVGDTTRFYMNKQGYRIPLNECTPLDILAEKKKSIENDKSEPECTREHKAEALRRQKRLDNLLSKPHQCRLLLNFFAVWDDCFEPGGYNFRKFNIYYYIEDQTLEIVEIHAPDSELDCLPSFLCRGKLYKNAEDESGVYKPPDFKIGCIINVYGRNFLITDADDFTKHYLMKNYNICNQTPIDVDAHLREELGIKLKKKVDEECSPDKFVREGCGPTIVEEEKVEESVKEDEDKPEPEIECKPKNTLYQMEGVLGFYSKLYQPVRSVDSCRRFILRFYLEDYTIKISELPHPNTGIPPGTLLSRQRVKMPESRVGENFEGKRDEKYFEPKHFYIGNILQIYEYKFDLLNADEATLSLMEKYSKWFPQSNICAILIKIIYTQRDGPVATADVIRQFSANDTLGCGTISASDFRNQLICYSNGRLNEHELRTLIRTYRIEDCGSDFDINLLRAAIYTELLRHKYDGLDQIYLERIEYTLRQYDPCRTSNIDRDTARSILLGARLPVPKELVDLLFQNFPASDSCNRINYCDLLEFIDWRNPSNRFVLQNPMALPDLIKQMERKPPAMTSLVNYRAFLEQICPNFQCALSEICCPKVVECQEECNNSCPEPEEYDENVSNSCCRDPCSITWKEQEYADLCGVSPKDLYGSGFKLPQNFDLPNPSCFQPPDPEENQLNSPDSSKFSHICPGCEPRTDFTCKEYEYASMANVSPCDLYGSGFKLPENFYTCNYNATDTIPSGCDQFSNYNSCEQPDEYQGQQEYNCTQPITYQAQQQEEYNCCEQQPITYQAQQQGYN